MVIINQCYWLLSHINIVEIMFSSDGVMHPVTITIINPPNEIGKNSNQLSPGLKEKIDTR